MLPELVELRLMFVLTLLELPVLPVLLRLLVKLLVRLDAETSVLKRLELSLIAIFYAVTLLYRRCFQQADQNQTKLQTRLE